MAPECVKKLRCKAKISLHKFRLVLGAVDSGQIKYKISRSAEHVQFLPGVLDIIFIDRINFYAGPRAVLSIPDIL